MLIFRAWRRGNLPDLVGVSGFWVIYPPLVYDAGLVNALNILPTSSLSVAVGTTSRLMDYNNLR